MIDEDEYTTIMNKYGEIKSESIDGLTINAKKGDSVEMPKTLDVRYTDGSVTTMKVDWNGSESVIAALGNGSAAPGTYRIDGTIVGTTEFDNPIGMFRADPYIYYNEDDGYYYFTASYMQDDLKNPYDFVAIKRAKDINDLYDAEEVKIFAGTTKAESGADVTPDYWAPEIHKIGGKFRILVQGTVNGSAQQCLLTCEDDDMMNPDSWSYTGFIENSTPYDMTYLECNGRYYYITQTWSSLGIAEFNPETPTKLKTGYTRIALPDRAYDRNIGTNQDILEGPAVLVHDDKVFLTYSGSTIDMHYCTNLLYADTDSNLLDAKSWTKLQIPLFTTADLTTTIKDSVLEDGNGEYVGQMGPGHSNFTVDENGNPLLVYHARNWSEHYASGNDKYGLSDPGRHAYVKSIHFGADGLPIFNMTPEQILSDDLRYVTLTVNIEGDAPATTPGNDLNNNTNGTASGDTNTTPAKKTNSLDKVGRIFKYGKFKYKITKKANSKVGKAKLIGAASGVKKLKKIKIPKYVKSGKKKYKVTATKATIKKLKKKFKIK